MLDILFELFHLYLRVSYCPSRRQLLGPPRPSSSCQHVLPFNHRLQQKWAHTPLRALQAPPQHPTDSITSDWSSHRGDGANQLPSRERFPSPLPPSCLPVLQQEPISSSCECGGVVGGANITATCHLVDVYGFATHQWVTYWEIPLSESCFVSEPQWYWQGLSSAAE